MKVRIKMPLLPLRCYKDETGRGGTENQRLESCRKKARLQLLLFELLLIAAFIAGYFVDPQLLRSFWLVLSGTLIVLTGINYYLL